MTERKWTKGPWTIEATTLHAYITPPKGHYVASVILPADTFHMSRPEKRKRSEMANAHLIAASPALYEALEPFDRALDDFRSNFTDEEWKSIDPETHLVGNGLSVADLLRARSALKKARGET